MKNVKGGSSRFVSTELLSNEWFDWQDHYGAFSIAARDREKVIAYILNQKQRHVDGSLYLEAEETD